jgi:hypothetical protein
VRGGLLGRRPSQRRASHPPAPNAPLTLATPLSHTHPSGLIAASCQDAAGQLHAQAWDVYSGVPDRRCSGAAAHTLMAQLSHEASSSLRAHQQQEADAARASLDGAPAPASDSPGGPRGGGGGGSAFAPRLSQVEHSSGPIRQLPQRAPRALLVDVDVGSLLAEVAAIAPAAPPPPPALPRHGGPGHAAADDAGGGGSAHSGGLYIAHGAGGLYAGGGGGPAGSSLDLSGERGGHAGGSAAAAAAAARTQWELQIGRARRAATALALLHRWGLDADADAKLAALLAALGLAGPAAAGAAAPADGWWAAAGGCGGAPGSAPISRAGSFPSPAGPDGAPWGAEQPDAGGAGGGVCGGGGVLSQEACVGEEGAVVAGLPYRVEGSGGGAERLGALFLSSPGVMAGRCGGGGCGALSTQHPHLCLRPLLCPYLPQAPQPPANSPSAPRPPTPRAGRLLALVSICKALLTNPATYSGVPCANAASALVTLYVLTWRDAAPAARAPLPDLLLLGSYYRVPSLADSAPVQPLHHAASTLLSSLLAPPPPPGRRGTGGGGGGPSPPRPAWPPPAALELLALLRAHRTHHGGGTPVPIQQLRRWRPQIVVAALAVVSHADAAPPGLLSSVARGLLDCLVRLAPAPGSCLAAELLELALLSGQWDVWRPHVGSVAPLLQRCAGGARLQQSAVGLGAPAARTLPVCPQPAGCFHLLLCVCCSPLPVSTPAPLPPARSPSLCRIADAVQGRISLLQAASAAAVAPPRPSLEGAPPAPLASAWLVADPAPPLARSPLGGGGGGRGAHSAGGLYLSAALMAAASPEPRGAPKLRVRTSPAPLALPRTASAPAPAPATPRSADAAAGGGAPPPLPPPGTPNPLRRTSTGLQYDYPGESPASPAWQLQPSFLAGTSSLTRADGSLATTSATPPASPAAAAAAAAAAATGGAAPGSGDAAAAPVPALLVSASAAQLGAWLRCCAEVMAGLALVEPDAYLNEISQGLAGGFLG